MNLPILHHRPAASRRDFITRAGAGFGSLALTHLLGQGNALASIKPNSFLPNYFGKAKSVIFLFMEGGPSHIDLFDPKPDLNKLAGQQLPPSFHRPLTAMGRAGLPHPRQQAGMETAWPSRHLGVRLATAHLDHR